MDAYKEYIQSYEQEFSLIKENKGVEALKHYNEIGRPVLFKLNEKLNKEIEFNMKGAETATKQGSGLTSITNWTMTIVIIVALLISAAVALVILSITKSIKNLLTA